MALLLVSAFIVGELSRPLLAHADAKSPANDAQTPELSERIDAEPGPLVYAALVPGLFVHGLGHLAAGRKETARKLMRWELVGLGMMTASGLFLWQSGASRYGNEVVIPTLMAGTGIFLTTLISDQFGTLSGGTGLRGVAQPRERASLGYSYLHSPHFDESHFLSLNAELSYSAWRLGLSLRESMTSANRSARIPVTFDVFHNPRGERGYVQAELTHYRHGDDQFTVVTAEASAGIRFDLDRLAESLSGAFVRFATGIAYQSVSYPGISDRDGHAMLVGGLGYGFYLPRSGELEGYYEHRRDHHAGGISPGRGQGSGFVGSFGIRLRQLVSRRFAVIADAQFGAAWLGTLQLEVRGRDR